MSVTPTTDWTSNAINHYVHHFVVPSVDGIPGLHNHIPMMYARYPDKGYLQNAVKAVAMANLARVNRMNQAQFLEAQKWYCESIRGLRIALCDAAEINSAATLMMAEVLSQYDVSRLYLNVRPSIMNSPVGETLPASTFTSMPTSWLALILAFLIHSSLWECPTLQVQALTGMG